MRENIISEYNILMREMENSENKYELEVYRNVNSRIDKILSESHDRVEKLETLICTFEAKGTNNCYYATLALAYAVVSFYFGLFTSIFNIGENKQQFAVVVLIIGATASALFGSAVREHRLEQNRAFILSLLRFRYENLKNKEALQKTEHSKTKKEEIHKDKKV